MLDRLSKSQEMAEAFAPWALSGNKALLLIDACVEAHRLDTGEHEAQVERLRRFPDYKETQAKQAELESRVKDSGAWTENVRAAFDVIRTTLALHNDIREFNSRATSQKAVKAAARSRAIGRLKESVRVLSRRPNIRHVIILCEVVLDAAGEISLDAVKDAMTPSEWLDRGARWRDP